MTISEEMIIAIISFIGAIIAVSWRFSKMQEKQNNQILQNAKAINVIDERTTDCSVHKASVGTVEKRVEEVEGKLSKQSGFNIQTEKQVTQLVTEFTYFKEEIRTDVTEMKSDIKTLLKMRTEENT